MPPSSVLSPRSRADSTARAIGKRRARRSQASGGADRARADDVRGDGIRRAVRPDRQLLSIGYRVTDGTLDPSCYDLLASEARLASFVAIAKGDVPTRHWFHLGRTVTPVDGGAALISWSGSMFEYLMPSLVMRAPPGVCSTRRTGSPCGGKWNTARGVGLPWGVSESAYNARDLELTYQYSSFGVPGLGLKRGLGEDAVVAPYATALAAMIAPRARCRTSRVSPARAGVVDMAGTRRWTTRPPVSPRARRWPSCAPTWRTIRA